MRVATFCFIDVAGFTALTEAHGDDAAVALLERFTAMVVEACGEEARVVTVVGDAAFLVSSDPQHAVQAVRRLWDRASEEPGFPALRAGLHHGEAVERGSTFFGSAVNLAARVAAQAAGGQVLATAPVASAARQLGVEAVSLGPQRLRNLRDPVELFALQLGPLETSLAIDPVCRMRVSPERAAGRLRAGSGDYWFCSLGCASLFAADPDAYTRPTG